MAFSLAITGKGGVGKTTLAGLTVGRLIARGCAPVLAVDADPNTCLDEVLGVRTPRTVGAIREEARQIAAEGPSAGIPKPRLLEMKVAECLVEAEDFDIVAMGRPEGPGCYCYANNVLAQVIRQLADRYPFLVVDNEAGLENLSRRIIRAVDVLAIVADATKRGLETARRLHGLAAEMEVRAQRVVLVVNRLRQDGPPGAAWRLAEQIGADVLVGLPEDRDVAELAERGGSMLKLPPANPVVARVDEMLALLGVGAPSGAAGAPHAGAGEWNGETGSARRPA